MNLIYCNKTMSVHKYKKNLLLQLKTDFIFAGFFIKNKAPIYFITSYRIFCSNKVYFISLFLERLKT